MTVKDCTQEILNAEDAIDILDRYNSGELPDMTTRHVEKIRLLLNHYMETIYNMSVVINGDGKA